MTQISSNGVVTFNGALPDDHESRQLPFSSPTDSGDAMIAIFWADHGANHEFPNNKVLYGLPFDRYALHDAFVHFCDNCSRDFDTQWSLGVKWKEVQPASLMGAFSTCAADDISDFEECQLTFGCDMTFEECKDCPTEREIMSACFREIREDCWHVYYDDIYLCAVECEPGDAACFKACEAYYGKETLCSLMEF